MVKLNYDGKKIRDSLKKYMTDIGEYKEVENALTINDAAVNHQLYIKYLDRGEKLFDEDDSEEAIKIHALANKFFVNYTNALKSLGIGPMQRKKLAIVEKELLDPNSIFQQIGNMMKQSKSQGVIAEIVKEY